MEKVIEQLESAFQKEIERFEKNPIKTSIKLAIIIYVVKKIYAWLKEA